MSGNTIQQELFKNRIHAAKVVVSDASYSYDNIYTYIYPDDLVGKLLPGMRVLVPFGRGNAKRIGVVMSVYKKPQPDDAVKNITCLIDDEPLVNDELLDMIVWLKEHTFCTYFEAYHTIVPSGYTIVKRSHYRLANSLPDLELSIEETNLYNALLNASSEREFDDLLDCRRSNDKQAVINSLVEKGVLERIDDYKRRVGDETVRMICLSSDYMIKNQIDFTVKQKLVVDFLLENHAASVKETCYYLSVTNTIISNMIKKGVLNEYRYEALRVPERVESRDVSQLKLSNEQQAAFDGIAKLLDMRKPAGALLHGVTGSGKTAVFIAAIKRVLDQGRTAIMLVPEIALTPQTVERFTAYFGQTIAVIHSGLSLGQRMDEFKRIKRGDAKIVIGTRSAVFAPLSDIGIIIMDEEGEPSYKSESSPRYHARDVAIKRCGNHSCLLLMASATPSLETYYYAKSGRFSLFELNNRYGNTKLPQVVVADMITEAENGNESIFCLDMTRRIKEELNKGHQAILLLNRRGYNTTAGCLRCHSAIKCPKCLVPLTYHKSNGKLMCHHCGYYEVYTGKCRECGSESVRLSGVGTQYIEQELSKFFPDARILRMDADTTTSRCSYEENFQAFGRGEYDIMVGTQMIAKGLDFPGVTTVGVISLDNSLFAGDYKSYERTFSLLTQVLGRGGRGEQEAVAYIQTFVPDHHIIELASKQDYKGFYLGEIALRKELTYPPFCDICMISFLSTIESHSLRAANEFVQMMKRMLKENSIRIPLRVFGPAKYGFGRINGRYKYQLTIKCRNSEAFRLLISTLLKASAKNPNFVNVRVTADLNSE